MTNTDAAVASVADLLGLSRAHVRRLVDHGELASLDLADVMAYDVERQRDRRDLAERRASVTTAREHGVMRLAEEVRRREGRRP